MERVTGGRYDVTCNEVLLLGGMWGPREGVGFCLMTVWMLVGDGDIAISQPSRLSGDSDYVVEKMGKRRWLF